MPLLKGALHVHTTLSDGQLTPQQAAAQYARLGFDFVALTDHDYLLRPNHAQSLQVKTNGLLVLPGVEITLHERGYVHVNRITGSHEVLHIFNHPAEYDLEFHDLLRVLEAVAQKYPIDAVEVSSKGFYTPEYDNPRIPYPKVASDDSHTAGGCGRAWIEVESERDADAIIRAIKNGAARPCFR